MDGSNFSINEQLKGNQIKAKNKLEEIKSKYIIQLIFDILIKKKALYIIKYNKIIQKRMDISAKDYKEYSEKFSPIEIEIVPEIPNNCDGKFININKEDEIYYHIYFNDNKEEIKRNDLNYNDNVSKIKIIIDYQVKSFYELFNSCECIEYINFKKFYRNNINNMADMFYECSSLKELNFSNFNINNTTDIRAMFFGCFEQFQNKIRKQYKNIKEETFNEIKFI